MKTTMYPNGQHPYWCDLDSSMCGDEVTARCGPSHIGRTSHMFVQSAEGRITLQLARYGDHVAPAGTRVGDIGVLVTMTDAGCVGSARAFLSIDEMQTLALLAKNYTWMVKRENKFPMHTTPDVIREEGPC